MIASFLHDLVFIKTRKTGGTSVEIVLSSWCGPDDICTALAPEDELMRLEYGGMPRNHSADPRLEAEHLAAIRAGDLAAIKKLHRRILRRTSFRAALHHRDLRALVARARSKITGRPIFRNHMRAAAVRRALPDLWGRAFKFTVDRHPYEKVISMAYWRRERDPRLRAEPFDRTLDDLVRSGRYANHPFYMKDGKLLVDAVFRTEEMWRDIAIVGRRIGRELPEPLPRAKSGHRDDTRPAREILTALQRAEVARVCAVEFDLLGYER